MRFALPFWGEREFVALMGDDDSRRRVKQRSECYGIAVCELGLPRDKAKRDLATIAEGNKRRIGKGVENRDRGIETGEQSFACIVDKPRLAVFRPRSPRRGRELDRRQRQ